MLENNNILISRSLFSNRQRHQTLDGNISTIFETDYSTIQTNLRQSVDTGNFKIIFNTDSNASKKYGTGNWIQPSLNSGDLIQDPDNIFWTYNELVFDNVQDNTDTSNTTNDEAKLKLDFSLLTSFAYFGSLIELIRSSVENIIETFPGSLWIRVNTDNTIYELSNPFNLDLQTEEIDADPLNFKILSKQFQNYEVVKTVYFNGYLEPCGIVNYKQNQLVDCRYDISSIVQTYWYVYVKRAGWAGTNDGSFTGNFYKIPDAPNSTLDGSNAYYPYIKLLNVVTFNCSKNNDSTECDVIDPNTLTITLSYIYNDANGEPCTLLRIESRVSGKTSTGDSLNTLPPAYHIKPKQSFIDLFFQNLNDFQSVLLSTYTNPRYTSNFKVPDEDETGVHYVDNIFTWTTPDGWNIDVTSLDYVNFMDRLINAAEFFDNFKTDNLYRMLTHDSIKNMDWSFERIIDEIKTQEYIIGGSRINKILRIYGRAYDELKKFIRGIEVMNNLSYDEKDNYPDVYLKVNLEYEGWRSLSLVNSGNIGNITNNLYYGHIEGYSINELETEFYRRLLLNSPYITRWKGTKHGLEMLMNLFGIDRNDWDIQEFIYVANASNFCAPNGCNNLNLFKDQVNITNTQIKEGYIYRVLANVGISYYVTYNAVNYYNGDSFIGVYNVPNYTSTGGATVYMDELENLAYLNKQRSYTMNGAVYYEGELSNESEAEYDDPDDLHDLCVERFYYGNFITCPVCGTYDSVTNTGGGVTFIDGQKAMCPRCNGTGVIRKFYGVPVFKGNSEILYYQQFGEWYQQTFRSLKMANTLDELYRLNRSDLTIGDVYFVNNSNVITDITYYWTLVNLSSFNDIEGWFNMTKTGYDYSINNQDFVGVSNTVILTQTGSGNNATGIATISIDGKILDVTLTSGGSGYTAGTIHVAQGTNSTAIGSIVVNNGAIQSVTITNGGTTIYNPIFQINFYILENTKDITDGNNPHGGDYDMGISYLKNIGYNITTINDGILPVIPNNGLFKYVIDNSPECIQDKPQYLNMIGKGFMIKQVLDTKKCWGVYNNTDNKLSISSTYNLFALKKLPFVNMETETDRKNCNIYRWQKGINIRTVDYSSINNLEFYRIINTKNIKFTYRASTDYKLNEFNNTILHYIEEMIPSTTIIELYTP